MVAKILASDAIIRLVKKLLIKLLSAMRLIYHSKVGSLNGSVWYFPLLKEKTIITKIGKYITINDKPKNAVRINSLDEGVFFSQLEIESIKLGKRIIDARPSDAIAIALRMDTPILVAKKVLEEAGLLEDSLKQEKPKKKREEISIENLRDRMQSAIEDEEYEIAAKLRDRISKLES